MRTDVLSALEPKGSTRGLLSVLSSSLFFFFLFIQLNMYNALGPSLMESFHINTTQLGNLSACYYYTTIIFFIPAGLILDRVSTRAVMLLCMATTILMTVLLSFTHSYTIACITRVITGFCGCFGLLGCIRIAAQWFRADKLAGIIGLVVTIAMLGGICAQTPFTYLVANMVWRHVLLVDALVGVFLLALFFFGVADSPSAKYLKPLRDPAIKQSPGLDLIKVMCNKQNWLAGGYTFLMNLPIMVLGAIWGVAYLVRVNNLDRPLASTITSLLFLGTIFGSPFFGYISDSIGKRIPLMRLGAIAAFILFVWIIYIPGHNATALSLAFFAVGFFTASQVLGYPLVTESNPPHLLGAAQGLNSMLIMLSGAFQPIYGAILHAHQTTVSLQNIPIPNYQHAMLLFVFASLISLILCFGMQEGREYAAGCNK
jgi:MFS family permease